MTNRSYLTTTDVNTIYPSTAELNYDPGTQTIAQGICFIPLLWLGLFNSSNIRTQTFDIDGDSVTLAAPIVDIRTAAAQLRKSAPIYSHIFPGNDFTEYCDLLIEAITTAGQKYVTIEMEEIFYFLMTPMSSTTIFVLHWNASLARSHLPMDTEKYVQFRDLMLG